MARFPFFRDIAGERALVVGGGEVALRRARALADFGAEVLVVAPEFCSGVENSKIKCEQRVFAMTDLDGVSIVVAATDNGELNARIGRVCRNRGIEINISDDPSASTFHFPGLVRRGTLTVGISTDGASPVAAKFVRERIEEAIPDRFEKVLVCMEAAREVARSMIDEQKIRSKVLKMVFDCCMQSRMMPDEHELEDMIRRFQCTEMD